MSLCKLQRHGYWYVLVCRSTVALNALLADSCRLGSKEPTVFQNKCLVWSGETVAVGLELEKDGILMQCSSEHAGILQVVLRMLNKLKEVLGKLETSWILHYYIDNEVVEHRDAKVQVLAPWFKDEASSLASQRAVLKLDALL